MALQAAIDHFLSEEGRGILDLDGLQLTEFPPLNEAIMNSIRVLICSNNQLTSLPSLPPGLARLYCNDNRLTSLPELPPRLSILECRGNALTHLPNLPDTLVELDCQYNQLRSLPRLPDSLLELICNNNQLTSLPTLPPNLEQLRCDSNQLTTLPYLPTTLNRADLYNNPYAEEELRDIVTNALRNINLGNVLVRDINAFLLRAAQERAMPLRTLRLLDAGVSPASFQAQRIPNKEGKRRHANLSNMIYPGSGVNTIISSYLTGESGTQQQQMNKIRETVRRGGKRRSTRRKVKKTKKTRKH